MMTRRRARDRGDEGEAEEKEVESNYAKRCRVLREGWKKRADLDDCCPVVPPLRLEAADKKAQKDAFDFHCGICHEIPLDPFTACPSSHIFCGDCLDKWQQTRTPRSRECPVCSEELSFMQSLKESEPFAYRLLGRIRVKCLHSDKGCNWKGDYLSAVAHIEQCPEATRICHKCSQTYANKDQQKHYQDECAYRPVPCQYCNRTIAHYFMEKHLSKYCEECPSTLLPCPLKGCHQKVRRDLFEAHLRDYAAHSDVIIKMLNESHEKLQEIRGDLDGVFVAAKVKCRNCKKLLTTDEATVRSCNRTPTDDKEGREEFGFHRISQEWKAVRFYTEEDEEDEEGEDPFANSEVEEELDQDSDESLSGGDDTGDYDKCDCDDEEEGEEDDD